MSNMVLYGPLSY